MFSFTRICVDMKCMQYQCRCVEKKQQKNKDWERLTWTIVCLLSVSGISPCHTGPDLRLYPGNGVKSFQ